MPDSPSPDGQATPAWRRLWPWAALLAYLALAYGPLLAEGRLLATGDALAYYFPIRVFVAECYAQGQLPFWNPHAFGGFPAWSPFQAGALFPGNWPFLCFGPLWAQNLTVLLAYFAAGAFTYGLGRAWGWGRQAACLAALAYVGCGFLAARLEHLTTLQSAALVPALLWAFHRLIERPTGRRLGVAALAVAGLTLAGHPQFMIQGSALALAWALHRLWPGSWASLARGLAWLAAACALGLLLSAAQVLPLVALLGEGSRTQLSFANFTAEATTLRQAIAFAFPFAFGSATPTPLFPSPYWGAAPFPIETAAYPGLLVLLLALVGLRLAPQDREARFWLAAAAAGFLLSLAPAPLYWLLHQLPILSSLRVPARHLFEVDLALALLAGHAWQRWQLAPPATRWAWWRFAAPSLLGPMALLFLALLWKGPAYGAHLQAWLPPGFPIQAALQPWQAAWCLPLALAALSAAALAWAAQRPQPWAQGLVPLLLAADLLLMGRHVGPHQQLPVWAAPPPQAPTPGRVLSLLPTPFPFRDLPIVANLGLPNLSLLQGEAHAGGAEGFLHWRRQKLLHGISPYGHLKEASILAPQARALDLLAVSELRALPEQAAQSPWREALQGPRWAPLPPGPGGVKRFANRQALPWAWGVAAWRQAPTEAVDRAVLAGLAPQQEALLDAEAPAPPFAAKGLPERLDWAREGPNGLRVRAQSPQPTFVAIAEAFDPGWSATLDGQPWPLHRVDGLIMGAALPPGAHELRLSYLPVGFQPGLAGSTLGLLLLAWLLRPRRRVPHPPS